MTHYLTKNNATHALDITTQDGKDDQYRTNKQRTCLQSHIFDKAATFTSDSKTRTEINEDDDIYIILTPGINCTARLLGSNHITPVNADRFSINMENLITNIYGLDSAGVKLDGPSGNLHVPHKLTVQQQSVTSIRHWRLLSGYTSIKITNADTIEGDFQACLVPMPHDPRAYLADLGNSSPNMGWVLKGDMIEQDPNDPDTDIILNPILFGGWNIREDWLQQIKFPSQPNFISGSLQELTNSNWPMVQHDLENDFQDTRSEITIVSPDKDSNSTITTPNTGLGWNLQQLRAGVPHQFNNIHDRMIRHFYDESYMAWVIKITKPKEKITWFLHSNFKYEVLYDEGSEISAQQDLRQVIVPPNDNNDNALVAAVRRPDVTPSPGPSKRKQHLDTYGEPDDFEGQGTPQRVKHNPKYPAAVPGKRKREIQPDTRRKRGPYDGDDDAQIIQHIDDVIEDIDGIPDDTHETYVQKVEDVKKTFQVDPDERKYMPTWEQVLEELEDEEAEDFEQGGIAGIVDGIVAVPKALGNYITKTGDDLEAKFKRFDPLARYEEEHPLN